MNKMSTDNLNKLEMDKFVEIKKSKYYRDDIKDTQLVIDIKNIINYYVNYDMLIIYDLANDLYPIITEIINEKLLDKKSTVVKIMDLYIETFNKLKNNKEILQNRRTGYGYGVEDGWGFIYDFAKLTKIDPDHGRDGDDYGWKNPIYMKIMLDFWFKTNNYKLYPHTITHDDSEINDFYDKLCIKYNYLP